MFKKILLAFDGSPEYRKGTLEGADLAAFCGADVHLLAIVASGMANDAKGNSGRILEDMLEQLRQRGIQADGRLGSGDPVDVITSTAREINADLIVVGHRRRNTINRWWRKSTSRNLLVVAPCSVLISSFLDGE
jgi:nucleotide-binding universal stress UspA family protein